MFSPMSLEDNRFFSDKKGIIIFWFQIRPESQLTFLPYSGVRA